METTTESQLQSRKNQCERVAAYLIEHGTITQQECDEMSPKIKRLASRIDELRHKHGMVITTKLVFAKGGDKYAEYHLENPTLI